MDEIDSLAASRTEGGNDSARKVIAELLVQMQGVGSSLDGVLVLGATNLPWELDPAIRRRFQRKIYIDLPDKAGRQRIF
jgi:vacuolar protein-sorting-associated protein 4